MTQQALQGACPYCHEVIDSLTEARSIVAEVAAEHRIPVDDLYSRSRKAYIVAARACAIRRIRSKTNLKLTAIGDLFGMHHTSILHSLNGAGEAAAEPSGGDRV